MSSLESKSLTEVVTGDAVISYLDEGVGFPLVVLPSLGRGPGDYDFLVGLLVGQGVRVIRPYPRGIGASTGSMAGLTLHHLAADVAAVIEHTGVAPVAVAGHAYGNFVARTLATDRPDLVRAVALVAASAGKTPDGGSPYAEDVLHAVYNSGNMELSESERLRHLQLAFFAPGNDARPWLTGWYAETKRMQREAQASTSVDDFFACGTAPILDLQAANDTVAPQRLADFLRQSLGERVSIEVIANAGHALIPEQPQRVSDSLIRWLSRIYTGT